MTEMLDKMDFVIMPVLNVDGYSYTWQSVCIHYHELVFLFTSSTRDKINILNFLLVFSCRLADVTIFGQLFSNFKFCAIF